MSQERVSEIRDAIAQIVVRQGKWGMTIEDLRRQVGDLDPIEFDTALWSLLRSGDIVYDASTKQILGSIYAPDTKAVFA